MSLKRLLASAPSYGKVHNVVCCYAYFGLLNDITEVKGLICGFF